jgi:glycosyltransferase involved in cell wall biosynthesis
VIESVAIVCNESAGRVDAIRDHTFRLARAIRDLGVTADICLRRADGTWFLHERHAVVSAPQPFRIALGTYDAVILQYNPFMYGRWGFAPWLPLRLTELRRTSGRTRIALMVHEPYVPMANFRWVLMGMWQRAQLEAARLSCDIVFASIESWTRVLQTRRPFRPAVHLPVGSNLPDRRDARATTRQRLQLGKGDIVLASLSTGPAGRLLQYTVPAANALAKQADNVVLLHLGAGAADLRGLIDSVRIHQPGRLPAGELASWLSAADLFLAPFVDGVSTRRTSVMAALQHELPVVGTAGRLTDTVLAGATDALVLVPVDRPDLFADAVVDLARRREDAGRLGRAGRALYESRFDWPVVAARLLDGLDKTANARTDKRSSDVAPYA